MTEFRYIPQQLSFSTAAVLSRYGISDNGEDVSVPHAEYPPVFVDTFTLPGTNVLPPSAIFGTGVLYPDEVIDPGDPIDSSGITITTKTARQVDDHTGYYNGSVTMETGHATVLFTAGPPPVQPSDNLLHFRVRARGWLVLAAQVAFRFRVFDFNTGVPLTDWSTVTLNGSNSNDGLYYDGGGAAYFVDLDFGLPVGNLTDTARFPAALITGYSHRVRSALFDPSQYHESVIEISNFEPYFNYDLSGYGWGTPIT